MYHPEKSKTKVVIFIYSVSVYRVLKMSENEEEIRMQYNFCSVAPPTKVLGSSISAFAFFRKNPIIILKVSSGENEIGAFPFRFLRTA